MAIKIRILEEEEPKAAQNIFDRLFREHWDKLQQHDLLASEIPPARLVRIHEAIDRMDRAWLQGDLPEFKESIKLVESLYLVNYKEIEKA